MYRVFFMIYLLVAFTACKKHPQQKPTGVISTPHNWQLLSSPIEGANGDICFTSADTGFIFGTSDNAYLLRSTDGGDSWTLLKEFSRAYPAFNSFCPISASNILIARDSLYQTRDGGTSWLKPGSWSGTTVVQMVFTINSTGFILTDNHIYRTENAAGSWSLTNATGGGYKTLVFPDPQHGFAAGGAEIEDNATIYVASVGVLSATTDGGQNWTRLDTGSWTTKTQRFKNITAIDFRDAMNGIIATDDGALSQTVDGGVHWQVINRQLPGGMTAIKYDRMGRLYLIAANRIYSLANDGKTIGLEFTATDQLLGIGVSPANTVIVIGRGGLILKRT